MYYAKDDLHINEEFWCGPGVLGYCTPQNRNISIDALKITDSYDRTRVLEHEKQHIVNPDDDEYTNRLKTDLRLIEKGIPTKPAVCYS